MSFRPKTVTFAVAGSCPQQRAKKCMKPQSAPQDSTLRTSRPAPVVTTSLDEQMPDQITNIKADHQDFAGHAVDPQINVSTDGCAETVGRAIKYNKSTLKSAQAEKDGDEMVKSPSTTSPSLKKKEIMKKFRFDKNEIPNTQKGSIHSGSTRRDNDYNSQMLHIARHTREQCNMATHSHVRMVRHKVAHLRIELLKMEEEIKQAKNARNALEVGVYEMRKGLSTSQLSISSIQKRTRGGSEVGGVLRACYSEMYAYENTA